MIPRRIWGIETEYGLTCAPVTGHRPPLDADEAARLLFRPVHSRQPQRHQPQNEHCE